MKRIAQKAILFFMRHHSSPLEGCLQDGVVDKSGCQNTSRNKYKWFVATQPMEK